jgi:D-3-phosphoglycerate dehydrogenase
VLISEELAPSALAVLAAAGVEADVRLGLDRPALLAALAGAHALVVRSATQVDAEALAAGSDLVVVGRAGIGLDNIDVAEATRRGVMVVNAPQSNVVSAAEQTMALMLAQARNIPQAHHDLVGGQWNRSKWEGVELRGKTLGIVGLGRVGVLVAQRALAFGMRLIAYDPFISADRARQLGVDLIDTVEELVARADFLTVHLPKTPDTVGLLGPDVLAKVKPGIRIVNTARGGILDEEALAEAVVDGRVAGVALDVFAKEPTTSSPLFGLPNVVVTPHLGASTVEAQDHAGHTIAEQVVLALRGEFVPFAVNVDAREASETVRPFLPLAERLGQLFTGVTGALPADLEVAYEGQLADYDCRVLTLAVLKGLLDAVTDEPVSFVNAPQVARDRGLVLREAKSSEARDFVNLVSLRGLAGGQEHHIAGTLSGARQEPRIVAIDEHSCDIPPARYMLVVRNSDRPGQIGLVGTVLGRAGVNISDMNLGRSPSGEAALMVIATDSAVPAAVVAELQAEAGIVSARSIALP